MSSFDQIVGPIFMIFWVFWAVGVARYYTVGDQLLKLLAHNFPDYYASLGRPRYSTMNPIRNFRAQNYLGHIAFRGTPYNFPDDQHALALVAKLRRLNTVMMIAFIGVVTVMSILGVFFHWQS